MRDILHIAKYYAPTKGGMESVVQILVEASVQARHDVAVLAFGDPHRRSQHFDYKVVRCQPLISIYSLPISFRYLAAPLKLNARLLHLHSPNPLGCLAVLPLLGKRNLIITHHADILGRKVAAAILSPLQRYVYSKAAVIVGTSESYLASSQELTQFTSKTVCIPLGTTVTGSLPKKLGEFISVLAVGRMVPYKGFEHLVDAARRLPQVKFDLVGVGPMLANLKHRAAGLRNVSFHGEISESRKAQLFEHASLVCVPSITRAEAFGMTLIEGMSYACPVICTDIQSGMRDINVNNLTGSLVPPSDSEAIVQAILKITSSADTYSQMSKACLERVSAYYTKEKMVASYMQLYEKYCDR